MQNPDRRATGAALHIVHINSSTDEEAPLAMEMIRGARERGLDVTTEAYPYTAGSTLIQSALFDAWVDRPEEEYQKLEWPSTGERLTRASFERYRKEGGWVIMHTREEETNTWVTAQPDIIVASDGIPFLFGPAHPRGSGTHARVLGRYARDKGALSLMERARQDDDPPGEATGGLRPPDGAQGPSEPRRRRRPDDLRARDGDRPRHLLTWGCAVRGNRARAGRGHLRGARRGVPAGGVPRQGHRADLEKAFL